MNRRIWITWENQRRNRELSRALNARLFELREIDQIRNPMEKYIQGLLKTTRILLRERPSLVFCQNPSLILSAFLVSIKGVAGFNVCVDAHNAGLFPKEGQSALLGALSRYIQKRADLTIVTNEQLQLHVENNGGNAFILQDKIPAIPTRSPRKLGEGFTLLFICSYGEDEPYEKVFEAARTLDPGVHVYVTGNYRKRNINPVSMPGNVTLMGYVSEDEYVDMLNSVDATIDLTARDDCLVCGAYETVAVGKPQILSDTRALRSYFHKGAIYTSHSAQSIGNAIHNLIANHQQLREGTKELKDQLQEDWEQKRLTLESYLSELVHQENAP